MKEKTELMNYYFDIIEKSEDYLKLKSNRNESKRIQTDSRTNPSKILLNYAIMICFLSLIFSTISSRLEFNSVLTRINPAFPTGIVTR